MNLIGVPEGLRIMQLVVIRNLRIFGNLSHEAGVMYIGMKAMYVSEVLNIITFSFSKVNFSLLEKKILLEKYVFLFSFR